MSSSDSDADTERIRKKFKLLAPTMNEAETRLWVAAEAIALGYGGVAKVSRATGMAKSTIGAGKNELLSGKLVDVSRARGVGGGRRRLEDSDPGLVPALEKLIEPATRGDPESPLRWVCKSRAALSRALAESGHPCSAEKVGALLHEMDFTLQSTFKTLEDASHEDRNAQFEHIHDVVQDSIARDEPTISVDTKKKELVGNFENAGREWQKTGAPVKVLTYTFVDDGVGKAIPYGIYDIAKNTGWVNVGADHDTPVFAVRSIEKWWTSIGSKIYPNATALRITADAGGSNSARAYVWKAQLQALADKHRLAIHVNHFPPGTSKWNKVEHRLFSFITMNWRGRPLATYETIIGLISSTTTTKGLKVHAELDADKYPTGVRVSDDVMGEIAIERHQFRGEWNYTIHPREADRVARAPIVTIPPPPKVEPKRHKPESFWREAIAQQSRSGMTIKAWVAREGLCRGTFDAWRVRFSKE